MIEAIIFDMDGLLIDSEPLWQEAEQRVFATVGLNLTNEQTTETTGLRVDEVIDYWFVRFPWNEENISKKQLDVNIVEEVKNLIREK
jgi:sugar-phosphatase